MMRLCATAQAAFMETYFFGGGAAPQGSGCGVMQVCRCRSADARMFRLYALWLDPAFPYLLAASLMTFTPDC